MNALLRTLSPSVSISGSWPVQQAYSELGIPAAWAFGHGPSGSTAITGRTASEPVTGTHELALSLDPSDTFFFFSAGVFSSRVTFRKISRTLSVSLVFSNNNVGLPAGVAFRYRQDHPCLMNARLTVQSLFDNEQATYADAASAIGVQDIETFDNILEDRTTGCPLSGYYTWKAQYVSGPPLPHAWESAPQFLNFSPNFNYRNASCYSPPGFNVLNLPQVSGLRVKSSLTDLTGANRIAGSPLLASSASFNVVPALGVFSNFDFDSFSQLQPFSAPAVSVTRSATGWLSATGTHSYSLSVTRTPSGSPNLRSDPGLSAFFASASHQVATEQVGTLPAPSISSVVCEF